MGARTIRRFAFNALLALPVAWAGCTCGPPGQDKPNNGRPTLGELVYRIIKQNLSTATTCSGEYVTALEPHHEDFVTSFDHAISADIQNSVPELLGGTIKPVVDNGTLPFLTDRVGLALGLLVDDSFDPQRETLHSMVNLGNAQNLFESTMATNLANGLIADPELTSTLHSLRLLAEEHDGVDYVINDLMSLATYNLNASEPISCSGLDLDDVQNTLLRSDGFVDDPLYVMGTPAWMVRPDKHGNPAVLVDETTGKLGAPFVDADGDGAADVNAEGDPIDASGAVIAMPFLGKDGKRDAEGRRLNPSGGLLYDYYDAKRSALGISTQIAADFIAGDVHHDVAKLADAVLGQPALCTDGSCCDDPAKPATCRPVYSGADHPLADLTHLGVEILRFDKAGDLMDVMYRLMTNDAPKAEDLLVAIGDIAKAFEGSTVSITDVALYDALIGFVPIMQQIFTTSNTTGKSTPHLLVDLIASMTQTEKGFIPPTLGDMIEYHWTNGSTRIDLTKPRFYQNGSQWIDNRSTLEAFAELLDYGDCGVYSNCAWWMKGALELVCSSTNGTTISEVLVDCIATKSESDVQSLAGLANDLSGIMDDGARSCGCSDARAAALQYHLPALESAANTGSLKWVLPVARVFRSQGQIPTLVNIFNYVASDLQKSGTYNVPVSDNDSVVRRLGSPLLSAIRAGALGKVIVAFDVFHSITVPNSTQRATHLAVDTIDYAIRNRTVAARKGPIANSNLLAETLKVVRTIASRMNAAGVGPSLSNVTRFGTQYLTNTTTVFNKRILAHANTRMLLATGMKAFSDLASVSAADYTCYLDAVQDRSEKLLTSPQFATAVRIAKHFVSSPNAAPIEDWAVTLLRGKPDEPANEALRPFLQISAAAASSTAAGDDLGNVTRWLQRTAADNQSHALTMVQALDDMIQSDTQGAMLQIMRNMMKPAPIESGASPLAVFGDTATDVMSIDLGNACMAVSTLNVARLETMIVGIRDFLLDDVTGVTSIWKLVGTLPPEE